MNRSKAKGTASVFDRLWQRVDTKGPDDCWEWQGYRRSRGHGQIGNCGRLLGTHRVAWESANGPIPEGLSILHHCDNPPCCNPAHLYAGTQADNVRDCVARGRQGAARGVRNANAKLTAAQVATIRGDAAAGKRLAHIALAFGVTPQYVGQLVSNQWRRDA